MNILVKTFIVINLLLSALYCAFQVTLFTNRENWKENYISKVKEFDDLETKRKEQVDDYEKKLTASQNDVSTLTDTNSNLKKAKDELDVVKRELTSKLTNTSDELQKTKSAKEKLDEKLTIKLDELGAARISLEKAREEAHDANVDLEELRSQVVRFEKERSKLKADLVIVKSRSDYSEKKLSEKEKILERLEERGVDTADFQNVDVALHARVLSVKKDSDIVLLSVGANDKVKKGYRFTVFEGKTYKAKVMVESVYPSMCAARIIPGLEADKQVIREGDSASTKVY